MKHKWYILIYLFDILGWVLLILLILIKGGKDE